METYSRWWHSHQLLEIFIHCFVERDVFLFEVIDLSSCISSLEMIGNLKTSNSCGGFWFSSFAADSVDSGSHGFWAWEGRTSSKYSPKCTRKVAVPAMLVFSLKDLIVIIQKLQEIKFIHFLGGGRGNKWDYRDHQWFQMDVIKYQIAPIYLSKHQLVI